MDNFETDNQDKSNLVGDEKLMSDAVDRAQEMLRLIDEVRELRELAASAHMIMGRMSDESKEAEDLINNLKDSLRLMTSLVRTKYGNQDNLIYFEIEKAEALIRGES